jgi:hypothetical protein
MDADFCFLLFSSLPPLCPKIGFQVGEGVRCPKHGRGPYLGLGHQGPGRYSHVRCVSVHHHQRARGGVPWDSGLVVSRRTITRRAGRRRVAAMLKMGRRRQRRQRRRWSIKVWRSEFITSSPLLILSVCLSVWDLRSEYVSDEPV